MAACLFIEEGRDHNLTLFLKTLTIRFVLCGNARKLFKTADITSLLWKVAELLTKLHGVTDFAVTSSELFLVLPISSQTSWPCAELVNTHSAFDPGSIASAAVYGALLGASVEESLRCRLECGHQTVVLS